ncbi:hypothetical protein ACLILY_25400 [Mycobacterium sp. MS3]|uniref:hypothetical protein n=1 Tax=Mycobacterium sp. MS3 TaxID=3391378 RepID=UPI003989C981
MNPKLLVEVTGEPALNDVAIQVTGKLQAAIDSLTTAQTAPQHGQSLSKAKVLDEREVRSG